MKKHYEPSTEEEYMNPLQLQYFKMKLLAIQKFYNNMSHARLDALHNKSGLIDRSHNDNLMDVELINEDNHSYMQKEVIEALGRIENASYGYCEESGEEIGIKRLKANPIARHCIEVQEKLEKSMGDGNNMLYNRFYE